MIQSCCECRHFRMWKPEPEFCTMKKVRVDPLAEGENRFILRRGLAYINWNQVREKMEINKKGRKNESSNQTT